MIKTREQINEKAHVPYAFTQMTPSELLVISSLSEQLTRKFLDEGPIRKQYVVSDSHLFYRIFMEWDQGLCIT
jgi:hypothetical protein